MSDKKKAGGEYVTVTGSVRRVDEVERTIIFTDKRTIQIDDIINMEGEVFALLRTD